MGKQNKQNTYAKKMSKKKSSSSSAWVFWIIGIITLGVVVYLFTADHNQDSETAISYKNQPYLGDKDAPVNILEFGDYKCPVCKNFNESFFPIIDKELIQTGKVKFYFINYPFINVDSKRSAQFGEIVYKELGNDTFWKFHKLLYKKQPEDQSLETKDIFTQDFLLKTLGEVTAKENVKKVSGKLDSRSGDNVVDTDMGLVKDLGVTGTPALFVNGKKFEGNTFGDLEKMVDKATEEKK
jgi:protein-disulfide isomerase